MEKMGEKTMNRGEAAALGFIAAIGTISFYYGLLYFLVFDNLLIVANQLGYDLYPVEGQAWWLLIGFGFICALRAITRVYKVARRDYCNFCGKVWKN